MGIVYTAECSKCNRIYNFDVGISPLYNKNILLDYNSEFNLLSLFKEKNRKEQLANILKNKSYSLLDGYGYKITICDTCKNLYPRFTFTLIDDNGNVFETKFKCHSCRKKLRELKTEEILNNIFECPNCKSKIKFHISGEWN